MLFALKQPLNLYVSLQQQVHQPKRRYCFRKMDFIWWKPLFGSPSVFQRGLRTEIGYCNTLSSLGAETVFWIWGVVSCASGIRTAKEQFASGTTQTCNLDTKFFPWCSMMTCSNSGSWQMHIFKSFKSCSPKNCAEKLAKRVSVGIANLQRCSIYINIIEDWQRMASSVVTVKNQQTGSHPNTPIPSLKSPHAGCKKHWELGTTLPSRFAVKRGV